MKRKQLKKKEIGGSKNMQRLNKSLKIENPNPLKIEVTRFILFLTSSLHYQSYPGVSKIIFVQENEDSKDEFKESRK